MKVHHDRGMENADEGDMENAGLDHVPKSRKAEKRRLHKQQHCAVVTAKLESYEDLEARMEHMESLITAHGIPYNFDLE